MNSNGHLLYAADEIGAQVVEVSGQPNIGQALGDALEHQTNLHASQVGSKTEVRSAASKTNVVIGGPLNVEAPRIIKGPGVAVGGNMPHHDLVVFFDLDTTHFIVPHGLTAEMENRRSPAHHLVGHGRGVTVGI